MEIFERKRRNMPLLKKWSKGRYVFTSTLRGRPAWTNGHIAAVGQLPRHWKGEEARDPGCMDRICPAYTDPEIKPVEVVEGVELDFRITGDAVRFDSGDAINAAYYDELVRVGGVTWRQSKASAVIRADDADGRAVGVVMPRRGL